MSRIGAAVRRRWRSALGLLALLVFGAVAGAVGFSVQPAVSGTVGPGTVTVDPGIRRGATEVAVPPLGEVVADTHSGPMAFDARIDRIDIDRASALVTGSNPGYLLRSQVEEDLRPLLWRLARQSVAFVVLSGILAGLVLPRRHLRSIAVVVTGALGFVGISGAVAATSFEPTAFDQPRFEGALAQAPAIINTVQRHVDDVDVVESRLRTLSDRIVDLYRTMGDEAPTPRRSTTILHVSDLHSNPIGIELVEETAARFEVDAILDTGDLTSFGADIEVAVVDRIAAIDTPYYVVPGNHDSTAMRRALRNAGVEVLDPDVVEVGDVTILGVGDPSFTATNEVPLAVQDLRLRGAAEELRALVVEHRPDVVAVHNSKQLRESLGRFAVGLAGHVHEPRLEYEDGTVVIHAGSSGATGVGALMTEEDLPYQMQLLQFEEGRLVAVDRLEFQGTDGAFQLQRVLIDASRISDYPDPAVATGTPSLLRDGPG